MVSGLEIKHLRVFLQLVREKSATKVGADLGLSQQAVSIYLKKIRAAMKHELFLRHSNGFEPTEFAYKMAERVEALLLEFDRLGEEAPFDPSQLNRTVRVIANEYSQMTIIPRLFREMSSTSSKLKLEVIDFGERTHEEALTSGAADMVIGFGRSISDTLYKKTIKQEKFVYVSGPNTQTDPERDAAALCQYNHVAINDGSSHSLSEIEGRLSQAEGQRNVVATLSCYTSLKEFLVVNDAIALVPSAVAVAGGLKLLDAYRESIPFDVVVAWHRRVHATPLNRWLNELVSKSVHLSHESFVVVR